MEWEGSFDEFSNKTVGKLPIFPSSNLDTIEKELIRAAKSHNVINKHRYIMNLFESSDTAGIQDSQSYSPENTITAKATTSVITGKQDSQSYLPVRNVASESLKHKVMTMDEFLDSHPLPTNLYEVECQTTGKDFHFLRALNPWLQ